METLILSWYDGGYSWSIRFKNESRCSIEFKTIWFKEIKYLYEHYTTTDFINYIFKTFRFIRTIIICEDGNIEVYTRNKRRIK